MAFCVDNEPFGSDQDSSNLLYYQMLTIVLLRGIFVDVDVAQRGLGAEAGALVNVRSVERTNDLDDFSLLNLFMWKQPCRGADLGQDDRLILGKF